MLGGLRRLSVTIFGSALRMALAAGCKLSRIFGTASRSACAAGLRLSPALCMASRTAPAATPPQARGSLSADSRSLGRERSVGGSRGTPGELSLDVSATAKENGRVCGAGSVAGRLGPVAVGAESAGWLGAGNGGWLAVGSAGRLGAGAGRNVPPAVMRDRGGGGGFDTCRAGDIGAGGSAWMSGDESSMSRAPLTSSTSGAIGGLSAAGGVAALTAAPRDDGLEGAGIRGAPNAFALGPSLLEGAAAFGSWSWLTDGRCPGYLPWKKSAHGAELP